MTRGTRPFAICLSCFFALAACVETSGDDDTVNSGTGGDDDGGADDDGDGGDDGGGDSKGDGGDGTADPASAEQVADCRMSCDQHLLFECVDSSTHATCYALCDARSGTDIDLFTACSTNTLPQCGGCYDNLVDADSPGGDGGASPASCEDACTEWLAAGCGGFEPCDQFCASIPETLHELVAECIANRDGCTLPETCVFEDIEEEQEEPDGND